MSDSQRFPIAIHALAFLAHSGAVEAAKAVSSVALAASMPTNPVVVRRVTAALVRSGLIATRAGAAGGAWLLRPAASINLEQVLYAVGGCASFGCPPPGVKGCPVGENIPAAVRWAIQAASASAAERLSQITVADLLNRAERTACAPLSPDALRAQAWLAQDA